LRKFKKGTAQFRGGTAQFVQFYVRGKLHNLCSSHA